MTPVQFFFDFVSPYSWLALMESRSFAVEHGVRWELRPVVYAKLLDATGLVGPVEVDVKRNYTFIDVARCAETAGLEFIGPPAHPFRSLEALRTFCVFRSDERALDLAATLADETWGKGRDLTRFEVLAAVVRRVGLDATELEQRIADPATKHALRESTDGAIAAGVFGVPSFRVGDQLYWGRDRLAQLAAGLSGPIEAAAEAARQMLARPRGADRRRR